MSRSISNLPNDIAWCLLVPPTMTCIEGLLPKGWTRTLGTSDSLTVQAWTKSGRRFLLIALCAIAVLMLIYAYFFKA